MPSGRRIDSFRSALVWLPWLMTRRAFFAPPTPCSRTYAAGCPCGLQIV